MGKKWDDYRVTSWLKLAYGNCNECGLGAPDIEVHLEGKNGAVVRRWHDCCVPCIIKEEIKTGVR